MCNASQGQDGCRSCSAPSRLCEKCKKNSCRVPLYGLCIQCSIEDYGDGWQPLSETNVSEEVKLKVRQAWQVLEQAETEEIPKKKMEPEKISLAELLIPRAAEFIRSSGQVSLELLMAEFQVDDEVATHLLDFLLEEG